MTTILYEKLRGNPRRIKRFLNDLNIRRSIASRRGIELEFEVVAKLMVLEVLLPDQFQAVLSWLRTGELRDRLEALESSPRRQRQTLRNLTWSMKPPNQTRRARPSLRRWTQRLARMTPRPHPNRPSLHTSQMTCFGGRSSHPTFTTST